MAWEVEPLCEFLRGDLVLWRVWSGGGGGGEEGRAGRGRGLAHVRGETSYQWEP